MLQLSVEHSANTAILRCTGKIVAGACLAKLQGVAKAQRAARMVIDLEGVELLDAAGLGTLVGLRQWCDSKGMGFRLIHPNRQVRELLALTALDSVLEVQPATDEDELLREWACAES